MLIVLKRPEWLRELVNTPELIATSINVEELGTAEDKVRDERTETDDTDERVDRLVLVEDFAEVEL